MAATVVGLAGPGNSGTLVLRTGKGAEVLILMDRSSSMDANLLPKNVKSGGQFNASMPTKSQVVRELLSDFVARRKDDRFALMTFSTSPMLVAPFTQDHATVQAGLQATAIGRGLPDTLMGRALLAAIEQFEGRPYSGSRIVIVVSDGGAQLDDAQRQRIAAGLARQRIGLHWIYIRSGPNSPDLTQTDGGTLDSEEEAALHAYFKTLATPLPPLPDRRPRGDGLGRGRDRPSAELPSHLLPAGAATRPQRRMLPGGTAVLPGAAGQPRAATAKLADHDMKRLSVHAAFAVAAVAVAGLAAWQVLRLQQAVQLNGRIVAASRMAAGTPLRAASASNAASANVTPESTVGRDAPREVRLAHATALSKAGCP